MSEKSDTTFDFLSLVVSNIQIKRQRFITALGQVRPGKKTPPGGGDEAPRLHRTGGEAPCSMEGRKTRREENDFKGVENLPALLYTIV